MKNGCRLTKAGCFAGLAIMAAAIVSSSGSLAWADGEPENLIGAMDEETREERSLDSDLLLVVRDPSQHIDEAVQTFETPGAVYSVDFAPGGEQILTAGKDGAARLWDVDTGEEKAEFPIITHTEPQPLQIEDVYPSRPAAISPDGRRVVTGFENPPIRMWDVETGELIRTFTWGAEAVSAVAFSHDGSLVLAVLARRDDRQLRIEPSGSERGRLRHALTGNVIAKAWDAETGELLDVSDEVRSGGSRRHPLRTLLSPSPEDAGVMVGVWPMRDWDLPHRMPHGEKGYVVRRWNPVSGEELSRMFPVRPAGVVHAAYGAGGVPFFAVHANHLEIWDAAREVRVMAWPPGLEETPLTPTAVDANLLVERGVWLYWEPPVAFEVSPCGTHAVMAYGPEAPARLWNMVTGELLRSFTGHEKDPGAVAFSPCGDYVLTGSEDGTARLWKSGIREE